jgi:hypothetical protein
VADGLKKNNTVSFDAFFHIREPDFFRYALGPNINSCGYLLHNEGFLWLYLHNKKPADLNQQASWDGIS